MTPQIKRLEKASDVHYVWSHVLVTEIVNYVKRKRGGKR